MSVVINKLLSPVVEGCSAVAETFTGLMGCRRVRLQREPHTITLTITQEMLDARRKRFLQMEPVDLEPLKLDFDEAVVDSEAETDTEGLYRSEGEMSASESSDSSDDEAPIRTPRRRRRKEVETIGPITSPLHGMKLRFRADLIAFNPALKGRYFKSGDKLPLNAK